VGERQESGQGREDRVGEGEQLSGRWALEGAARAPEAKGEKE